jgi:hypothetical protein
MSTTGKVDLVVAARRALIDALGALCAQSEAIVVIGAQAVYLHSGDTRVALAAMTKDSDLAIDVRELAPHPLLEEAMAAAGFRRNPLTQQPGSWVTPDGIPVDLMVPDALAGEGGRRGARIPPHSRHAARRAVGLEAAVVDPVPMPVQALAPDDVRAPTAKVASPAALLVAKLHKLGERRLTPNRLVQKDAHDLYRLFVACPTPVLGAGLRRLLEHELSAAVTRQALVYLDELFASGHDALGSRMAGAAEEGVGEPDVVSASVAILAADLLQLIGAR